MTNISKQVRQTLIYGLHSSEACIKRARHALSLFLAPTKDSCSSDYRHVDMISRTWAAGKAGAIPTKNTEKVKRSVFVYHSMI